ncbi:MAG TPA: hypothetical protein VFJ06_14410 [Halococcus sp.]|nr:hypothetical protein [Halococcus sp.]
MKPVLVDTSSLLAYCKTNYDEFLFKRLQMTTTNVCNDEVNRQKSASDDFYKKRSCERYLDLCRDNKNPDIEYVERYKPNVENQGEQTLEYIFEEYPDEVKYILLFDFEAIEKFENLKYEIGGDAVDTRISLPNYAFELLRKNGEMSDDEYCKATYQMGVEEGWMARHAQKLASVSPVECDRFP